MRRRINRCKRCRSCHKPLRSKLSPLHDGTSHDWRVRYLWRVLSGFCGFYRSCFCAAACDQAAPGCVRRLSLCLASRAVRPGDLCDFARHCHSGSRNHFATRVRALIEIGAATMKRFFASLGRSILTLVVLLVAVLAGWQLWSYYMLEPWTRDGRVRADVVTIAADVPGLISDVFVY